MQHAKIFQSGRSQAVRLPKAFRFAGEEVAIKRFGNGVLLLPMNQPWQMLEESLHEFESGFHLEREAQQDQEREELRF